MIDAGIDDGRMCLSVRGSMDPVIKQAARYEVEELISHPPTLEEVFLAYYSGEAGPEGG